MSIDEMTQIWQGVLESDIRPGDHFFSDLGGDSLLAVELIEVVEQSVGSPVELELLFDHPTPEALRSAINALLGGHHQDD